MNKELVYYIILPAIMFVYFAFKDWLISEKMFGALAETTKIISIMVAHCVQRKD